MLVPWDLSEVTADGRPIEGGGDDSGLQIALVGVIVVAFGVVALARISTRAFAATYVAGGLATWTVLFGWRAGVSETDGGEHVHGPACDTLFSSSDDRDPDLGLLIAARLDGREGLVRA